MRGNAAGRGDQRPARDRAERRCRPGRAPGPGAAAARPPHAGQRTGPGRAPRCARPRPAAALATVATGARRSTLADEQVHQRDASWTNCAPAARQAEARRRHRARRSATPPQLRRSFAELRAPADGIISKRLVQPGQVVAAGSELLRLIRDGRLEWRAELPEAELARVAPGDGSRAARRATAAVVEGAVRAVSPGVDSADPHRHRLRRPAAIRGALQARHAIVEGRIVTGAGAGADGAGGRGGPARRLSPTCSPWTPARSRSACACSTGSQQRRSSSRSCEGLKPGARVVEQGAGFLGDGDGCAWSTPAPAPGQPRHERRHAISPPGRSTGRCRR